MQCQSYGAAPNTLAEFALNQPNNLDYIDIFLVDGFNIAMEFSPTSNGCTRSRRCTADINRQCPNQLKALAAATIPVPFSKPTNIAAILETVHLQIFPNFSKLDALMLIVTLRMTQQA
jgi:hypothetical protein